MWTQWNVGSGVIASPTLDGFSVAFPAFPTPMVGGDGGNDFGAGYTSQFLLRGDFVVDVDYSLSTWPAGNGVRVGIGIAPWFGANRGSNPGEFYAVGVNGTTFFVPTSNTTGTLRMVRTGSSFSGYYEQGHDNWILIGTGPVSLQDFQLSIGAWSTSALFGHQPVTCSLNNLEINPEALIKPNDHNVSELPHRVLSLVLLLVALLKQSRIRHCESPNSRRRALGCCFRDTFGLPRF